MRDARCEICAIIEKMLRNRKEKQRQKNQSEMKRMVRVDVYVKSQEMNGSTHNVNQWQLAFA